MKNIQNMNLLKNLLNSKDKKRYYSTNTLKSYNTYKCKEHLDFYNKICIKCNIDICPKCEKNYHINHQVLKYEDIFPDQKEIQNLQNQIQVYINTFENLRKEINIWLNEMKEKMKSLDKIWKKNEIINSYDLIMNYKKNKICLDNIFIFRKIYSNIIEGNNTKNNEIFNKLNRYENNNNFPLYLNFQEIKYLLNKINKKKDNLNKKSTLIVNYLSSIPLEYNNTTSSEKYSSYNLQNPELSISPIELKNSGSICDKSTGYDNNKISDLKENEFKNILNKTIITDFNLDNKAKEKKLISSYSTNNFNNKTFSAQQKKHNISTFCKYLNKMGLININLTLNQDFNNLNNCQNLLNQSTTSIKSSKYVNNYTNNNNFVYKKQNYIMNSPKYNSLNSNKSLISNPFLTNRKTQMKTYVHRKFISKIDANNKNNEFLQTEIKNFNNDNNNILKKYNIKSKIFNNQKNNNKKYESPIKQNLFENKTNPFIIKQNNIISKDKDNINTNDISNKNENKLLNIIFSPSSTKNKDTFTQKLNYNPPSIITTPKNNTIDINPKKDLYIGLEIGDSECKIAFMNQDNLNEIQIFNFNENEYSMPSLISFSDIKKEIKIGKEAEQDLIKNPSQTIFNIFKFFGKNLKDIKYHDDLLPFKIYSSNNEENKPYLKINFGPQKDKIFYFDNIVNIYLQKLLEKFFEKIKIKSDLNINNNIYNINTILVIAISNYFNYYQRTLIQQIVKDVIIKINNDLKEKLNILINLEKIKIENKSSIVSLSLNLYSDKINNNNLIICTDGGSTNISLINNQINDKKILYKVLYSDFMNKGVNDIIDDFMKYILKKFNDKVKKEILNSSFALVNLRKICKKLITNLSHTDKTFFNLKEILVNYDLIINISKNDYENSLYDFFFDLKRLVNKMIENENIKNCIINEIIFIGKIFDENKIRLNIEQLFKQKKLLSKEESINNKNINKDFYIVSGATYQGFNLKNNILYFQDVSQFNIGIEKYDKNLYYLIKKGDTIPLKNTTSIKIRKNSDLNIYELDTETKNKRFIFNYVLKDENISEKNYNINDVDYRHINIEYEIDEELNLNLKILD